MGKLRIKVVTLGSGFPLFDNSRIKNWKSDIFKVVDPIKNHELNANTDGSNWEYYDDTLAQQIPEYSDADLLLAITKIPLEENWFLRCIGKNRFIFTYYEIKDILIRDNIPIENAILRILYALSLMFSSSGNMILSSDRIPTFTHDENKGCLFDMNGIKTEIISSCHLPILCDACVQRLRINGISNEELKIVKKEIKKIKKGLYSNLTSAIKRHPILAIVISSVSAIVLGLIASILGNLLYDKLFHS